MPLYLQNFQAHRVLLNREILSLINIFMQLALTKKKVENKNCTFRSFFLQVGAFIFASAFQANRHRMGRSLE